MERAVFNQMIEFLEYGQILHPSHHGFRSKHSTSTALLQMQDTWLDALDRGEMSAVVLCDMSGAFNIVNHGILLKKLELYGFQDSAISWLKSYLCDRSQRVIVDGCLSDPVGLSVGVPQGSILGPLLYVCYTNDMPECIHNHEVRPMQKRKVSYNLHCHECGDVCCYADDSTFSKSSNNALELKEDIDQKYENIVDYIVLTPKKLIY